MPASAWVNQACEKNDMLARGGEPDWGFSLSLSPRHVESVQQCSSCQDMFPSSWLNRTSYAINREWEGEREREVGKQGKWWLSCLSELHHHTALNTKQGTGALVSQLFSQISLGKIAIICVEKYYGSVMFTRQETILNNPHCRHYFFAVLHQVS